MEKQFIKAKAKEFVIDDPAQPFKDDKLGRKGYAEILTGIVETFVSGAVVALNRYMSNHIDRHIIPNPP